MIGHEYINTSQAAAILDVSPGWVAALCRCGSLEAAKGTGKGAWVIKRSSVDGLAAERAVVKAEDLDDVAKEIEEDKQAQEFAAQKAEESFKDRVISIARKYGPGVLSIVIGVAAHQLVPGNPIAPLMIAEGIKRVRREWNRKSDQKCQ